MEQINETLAREAKSANSWNDYTEGSATASYNADCHRVREIAEARKRNIPEEHWAELDRLVEWYCAKLASWINRENSCRASCPSIMIAGGSNFPVKKKGKQLAREDTLMREYTNEIEPLLEKIESFGANGFAIMSGDANAIGKLEEKLQNLLKSQEKMKSANAYYRKNKTMKGYNGLSDEQAERTDESIQNGYSLEQQPYPGYLLTNNNANIKRVRERLDKLKREKVTDGRAYDTQGLDLTVTENKEIMRLQVVFEGKPSSEVRDIMKSAAFKWAPSQGAWQRQLTDNARYALRGVLKKLKECRGDSQ